MNTYHTEKYWSALAKDISKQSVKHGDILFLANLVLQDPASFWTKRALKKAVRALIAKDPQTCANLILVAGSNASRDLAWRGLVQDKSIMKCFRSHLTEPQYQKLLALAETLTKRRETK